VCVCVCPNILQFIYERLGGMTLLLFGSTIGVS